MPRINPTNSSVNLKINPTSPNNNISAKTTNSNNPVQAKNDMSEYWANQSKNYAEQSKYYKEEAEALTPETIVINSVTTGEPGTDAEVVNIGTINNAVLDITIPRGDKGEKGDKGDDGSCPTVIYEQPVASDTWTVQHNLNKINVRVVIIDSSGNMFHPPVTVIDENTCKIELIGATTGKAYIN